MKPLKKKRKLGQATIVLIALAVVALVALLSVIQMVTNSARRVQEGALRRDYRLMAETFLRGLRPAGCGATLQPALVDPTVWCTQALTEMNDNVAMRLQPIRSDGYYLADNWDPTTRTFQWGHFRVWAYCSDITNPGLVFKYQARVGWASTQPVRSVYLNVYRCVEDPGIPDQQREIASP